MKPNRIPHPKLALGALAVWLGTGGAFGQTSTPSTPKPEDPVELSPFTVRAVNDDDYYAPEGVAGTRTRTELINLPLSMTVFTEGFMKDIAARDLIDVVAYASGVSVGTGQATNEGDNTSFTLRGQVSFVPMRNGFRRLRLVGSANIERVEVLKGPSSMLYGQLNPGGSINYITKRPLPQKHVRNFSVEVGSYEFYRTTSDVNVPIIPKKLALRFVASYEDFKAIYPNYHNKTHLLNPSLTWWIRPETSITVEYEQSKRHINGFTASLPYNSTVDFETRPGAVTRKFNTRAPGDYNDTDMTAYTAEFIHRFNRNLLLRANVTKSIWYEEVRQNGSNINLTGAGNTLLNRRGISYTKRGSYDLWRQFELVNNFSFKGVDVQNIAGYQLETLEFRQVLASTQVTASPLNQWNVFDPSTWVVTELTEKDTAVASTTGLWSTNVTKSRYFTNQLSFWKGRVRTLAGIRADEFRVFDYNPGSTAAVKTSQSIAPTAKIPQVGVLFKATPSLSFYAMYSESFLPVFSSGRNPDGSTFNPKPQSGVGFDIGTKFQLMDGRIAGNAAVFQVENTDIVRFLPAVTIIGNTGLSETFSPIEQSGTDRSEGAELDLRLKPTKTIQVSFSYGYTDAWVKSDTSARTTLPSGAVYFTRTGHWLANAPKQTLSGWVRQELGSFGRIKGVYVMGGGRAVTERAMIEAYNIIGGVPVAPPTMEGYGIFDLGTGARFNIGKNSYNIALNVKNVGDTIYLENRFRFGAPRTFTLSLRGSF